jgi:hypothetical protein
LEDISVLLTLQHIKHLLSCQKIWRFSVFKYFLKRSNLLLCLGTSLTYLTA